jgi:lipid A 3-O-deacylase
MKSSKWVVTLLVCVAAGVCVAQRGPDVSPVSAVAGANAWNFGALVQGGVGLQDRTDFSFFMVGGHAGKALTSEMGTGLFKGNFEYGVEVFPFWQSSTPKFQRIKCVSFPSAGPGALICSPPYTVGGRFDGASITPIILRWNFTHGRRLMPWVQGAGGVVWTNHKYPAVGDLDPLDPTQTGPQANTSVWNFTPQGGVGAHYFVRPRRSIDFAANAVHISSASLGDKNPGVNTSLQFSVGYSWWK